MPFANFKSIFCVSSEDKAYPASNLLLNTNKKWKCESNGMKTIFVILQLEKSTQITGIDIGNEHSAFIEVLVGRNGWPQENFKEILLASSFMTPMEGRNSTNVNRVRCFPKTELLSPVCDEKWDLVKLVCIQEFNKHVQYGLSFVRVHCAGDEPPKSADKEASWLPKVAFGKFKIRESSPDLDDQSTSLFSKWREEKPTPSKESGATSSSVGISTAAAIREASNQASLSSYSPSITMKFKAKTTPKTTTKTATKALGEPSEDDEPEQDAPQQDRNRHSLVYDEEDDTKTIPKLEREIVKDRERIEKEKEDKAKASSSTKQGSHRDKITANASPYRDNGKKGFAALDVSVSSVSSGKNDKDKTLNRSASSSSANVPSPSSSKGAVTTAHSPMTANNKRLLSPIRPDKEPLSKKKKSPTKQNIRHKPFKKLLEGVVLVISGIQNPERAQIRDKAMRMGARYKPDWDNNCTHLICAFKNTPKYNQVKGHGKIVKKDWIIQCDSQRKRISWRRHAVDSAEMDQPESEDEIWDEATKVDSDDDTIDSNTGGEAESVQLSTTKPSSPAKLASPTNAQSIYDSDPDDGAGAQQNLSATENNIYDAETDEEPENDVRKLDTPQNETQNLDATQVLGDMFAGKSFHFSGNVGVVDEIKLRRIIVEQNGSICARAIDADYVISFEAYDDASDKLKGIVVKPLWIYESTAMNGLLPIDRYKL